MQPCTTMPTAVCPMHKDAAPCARVFLLLACAALVQCSSSPPPGDHRVMFGTGTTALRCALTNPSLPAMIYCNNTRVSHSPLPPLTSSSCRSLKPIFRIISATSHPCAAGVPALRILFPPDGFTFNTAPPSPHSMQSSSSSAAAAAAAAAAAEKRGVNVTVSIVV